MTTTWYCRTCGEEIDESAVDEHESRGHAVRGYMRPDRLLSNDPWQVGSTDRPTSDRAADEPTPDRTGDRTAPDPPIADEAAYRIVDEPTADPPTDEQARDRPAGDAEDDSE